MPRPTDARSLAFRLVRCALGAGVALSLAMAAAHYYAAPSLDGAARRASWLEPDFCFALLSCLVALGAGLDAGGALGPPRTFAAGVVRALIWFGLTVLLVAAWGNAVSLLTLLIAPSHAFLGMRLATLSSAFRAQRLWKK